jgi:hypothetical protein
MAGYDVVPARKNQRQTRRNAISAATFIRIGGFATRPCTVIDLSDTGVRISVEGAAGIPVEFTLFLSKNSRGRSARAKWRRGNQIGAKFI